MKRRRMVMVGGWAHNDASLKAVAARLAPKHDVVALSTAALGAEPKDGDGLSHYALNLSGRLAALDDVDAVVAWSMGAIVALELAARRSPPFSRLVAISATARFCSCPGYACGVPERSLRAMSLGLRQNPEQTLGRFISDVAHPSRLSSLALQLRVEAALKIGVDELLSGLDYLRRTDLRARLGDIGVPLLVMHGAADRIVPVAAGEELARGLSDSRFKRYAEVGHNLVIDAPDVLAADIETFLGATR